MATKRMTVREWVEQYGIGFQAWNVEVLAFFADGTDEWVNSA